MAEEYCLDGFSALRLAEALELPQVELLESTGSTMDVAHQLAGNGAPAGTLVVADRQTAGRGRHGRRWESPPGSGLWMTLIERPRESSGIDVLALRAGLRAARALDLFTSEPVRLKWPNDLFLAERKLGGVLIEARWREAALEWLAIGLGINVLAPADIPEAAELETGTRRVDVISELIPGLRAAAAATGELAQRELIEYGTRDLALGRNCIEPARGVVQGIAPSGELLVALADSVARFRTGSLVLEPLK